MIGRIWLKWIDEEGWLYLLAYARITRRLSQALAAKVPCALLPWKSQLLYETMKSSCLVP